MTAVAVNLLGGEEPGSGEGPAGRGEPDVDRRPSRPPSAEGRRTRRWDRPWMLEPVAASGSGIAVDHQHGFAGLHRGVEATLRDPDAAHEHDPGCSSRSPLTGRCLGVRANRCPAPSRPRHRRVPWRPL